MSEQSKSIADAIDNTLQRIRDSLNDKQRWGDIEDDQDNQDNEYEEAISPDLPDLPEDELEGEEILFKALQGELGIINQVILEENCFCKEPVCLVSSLKLMYEMRKADFDSDKSVCILNTIVNCYNKVFSAELEMYSPFKVAFADQFYKLRHEMLFKLLCLSLNLPAEKSDTPFSNWGLKSNRTPDLIVEEDGLIKIIEVTVTSSIEKAAISKGMEQMGFESKYQKEIDELRDKGHNVIYLPMFFDMRDHKNPVLKEQFNKLTENFHLNVEFKNQLFNCASQLSILTNDIKFNLAFPATILFTDSDPIIPNHPNHKFLYHDDLNIESNKRKYYYSEITISSKIYNKIINNWERLDYILDNSNFTENDKLAFVVDTSSHKIKIEITSDGVKKSELFKYIEENDKLSFFKNVHIRIGKKVIKCTDSDTGVKYLEPTLTNIKNVNYEPIKLLSQHESVLYHNENFNLTKYIEKCEKYRSQEVYCNYFDQNYEDHLIRKICEFDQAYNLGGGDDHIKLQLADSKLLGQIATAYIDIDEVMRKIEPDYVAMNAENDSLPRTRLKMKSPFLVPLGMFNQTSYCKLDFKNIELLEELIFALNDEPYTSTILNNVLDPEYKMYTKPKLSSQTLQSLQNKRMEISSEINRIYKQCKKQFNIKKMKEINDPELKNLYEDLRLKYTTLNKEITNRQKVEGVGKEISYIKLRTKGKNSKTSEDFTKEMAHFKDKKMQSVVEGVGLFENIKEDYKKDQTVFNNLCTELTSNCGPNPDHIFHDFVADDAKLLLDLKKLALNNYRNLINQVCNSFLGHATAFVSRLAHSLMFYSQQPFSSDYVRVDNLGYKDVFLIVKGGKKIFKTKNSKLFRLIYPISDVLTPWYHGHKEAGSYKMINISGLNYLITPWAFMHEKILTDALSFHHRVCSFVALNLNPELQLEMQFHKVQLNVLLAFHNRRKTEALLANMRYILLSTLGDYTGMAEIIQDFFGFNYDCFQSFIRNSIFLNYPKYFKTIIAIKQLSMGKEINESSLINSGLTHIFTNNVISSSEDLALMIYSTFLMTKAPYEKLAERARNLKGILKIHEQYDIDVGIELNPIQQLEKLDVECRDCYQEYSKKLFSNDFNFDVKYCALVGNFMDSYFYNEGLSEQLHTEWIRIMNMNWDEMATSTGLRGNYNNLEDFWGKKGYFVVYKKILSDPVYKNTLLSLFIESMPDDNKRKILRGLNKLFKDELTGNDEFLIFHAVDKEQWRDNREIYVMSMFTKMLQQPIEKFMGFVCSKLDNELISIPSDRRAQVIHHSIFEKDLPLKDVLTWYLTLDCSKWAPKSIFIKFALCFNNMSCLPNGFKIHFMNYIEKLFEKRLYFNTGEVEVLMKNPIYKPICDKYLKLDNVHNGYYINAPYSWVMGIFNYTSSFLHAANQKYFSYLLARSTAISYQEDVTMTMYAHSDDSGGRICVPNKYHLQRALILYEINLHSANHLLSKKKSVVSRIYFEILSIIYLFKKLLALLPKFLGGLRFLPSDKGPAQDLLQCYSKSIEVIVSGADFSISYIVLKIMSHLVFKFYFNKDPTDIDYNRPVQFVGMPDAHPILILLCGSDADLLRLVRTEEGLINTTHTLAYINSVTKNLSGEGPIKPLKFVVNIKNINKDFKYAQEVFASILENWSIKNVNYHNTGMNSLSFLKKLNDTGFVGSLVNESTVRRISRSYYHRIGNSTITNWGNIKLSRFIDSLKIYVSYQDKESALVKILENVFTNAEIIKIQEETEVAYSDALIQMQFFKKTMLSPLRLMKYFERLSMEDRKIVTVNRTLKPTMVQLTKGGRVFSVDFDPASLVSYLKEPELKWALNNLKNLNTAAQELDVYVKDNGKTIEGLDSDILLRICRTFGKDNTKNIYIYSRVPSHVRQVKTYSAFLTFLSVNSIHNKEIEGLTIKLPERDLAKEYVMTHISEEIYLMNNIVSLFYLLIQKCDLDFITTLNLNEISELKFDSGSPYALLSCIKSLVNEHIEGVICAIQINVLTNLLGGYPLGNGVDLMSGAFYTFIKDQKAKSGWYGKGEVYIYIKGNFYSFELFNSEITHVITNKTGKIDQVHERFILDVFENINIKIPKSKPKVKKLNDLIFGYDLVGTLSISGIKEIEKGVPVTIRSSRGGEVDELKYSRIISYSKDYLIMLYETEKKEFKRKVYLLPLKKAEIIPLTRQLLNFEDFTTKMNEKGLNDFEDFLMTELLPEYGSDLYINFDMMIDNYTGSKLYEIFHKVSQESWSKLPIRPEFAILPACETSLIRILIDYSNNSNDSIIKSPKYLDSDIMRIRSEYPEQMPTILSSNMINFFDKIYTPGERKEIKESFMKILNSGDIDVAKQNLVKLLSHWGYTALVNNIAQYTLIRSANNYRYYNILNCVNLHINFYSDIFVQLLNCLIDLILKFHTQLDKSYYIRKDLAVYDVKELCSRYVINLVLNLYGLNRPMNFASLVEFSFNNLILNLMSDEDFTVALQDSLENITVLSSLVVDHKNRKNFLIMYNTLKYAWIMNNKVNYQLDYLIKVQRLPVNIPNPKSIMNRFNIKLQPGVVHYHGVLNNQLIGYFISKKEISIGKGETRYLIDGNIKKLSTLEVPILNIMSPIRPLQYEVFDNADWEDLVYECKMGDIDEDTIIELWDLIPNKYVKKRTFKKSFKNHTKVSASISWIISPNYCGQKNIKNWVRQQGENLVVITETVNQDLLMLPNSGVRIVNFSNITGVKMPPMLAYYSFQDELNNLDFINQLLGGKPIDFNRGDYENLLVDTVRDSDGVVKRATSIGLRFNLTELTDKTQVFCVKDDVLVPLKEDDEPVEVIDTDPDIFNEELTRQVELFKKLDSEINEIALKLNLSAHVVKNLKTKYKAEAFVNLPITVLFHSLMGEAELITLNKEFLEGGLNLTKQQQVQATQNPAHFGLAYTSSKVDRDPIRDKKLKSEVNSIHSGLANLIASSTLMLSKSYKNVLLSHYKMWFNMVKHSNFKTENKKFLLQLFLTLINNATIVSSDEHDIMWHHIIDKFTVYIAQTLPESDDDDEDIFTSIYQTIPGARLRYTAEGA